jgi:hypothetical protein
MAGLLQIGEAVLTGETLSRQHQGQTTVQVACGAIITPTGWDYIRQHRLQLVRGDQVLTEAATGSLVVAGGSPVAAHKGQGPADQADPAGRCDHPNQPCGCRTDEFGSGFVEPSSCHDCPIHALKSAGQPNCGCEGCNRHKAITALVTAGKGVDLEELVQQVTDQIMARTNRS